jgi:ADP-ribose pyrophosphatase
MPSQFKLLNHKKVLQSRVFYVRDEKWRGPNDSRFQRHTVVHPGAVAILPFDAKGRVLMIRQFRPAANDWLLEIPAGTLEKGEAPLACAKRELIEEIGFAARKWKKLGAVFTAPGFCTERIHLYKAWDLKAAFAEKDEDEHIELAAMTMSDVRRAIKNGKICDAKTMSALMCLSVM